MKRNLLASIFLLGAICFARADDTIASAQQALKEQGFYYGEITGHKDADTAAAIRRYQIRNGLKITGEVNEETQRSLRAGSNGTTQPRIAPRQQSHDEENDLHDEGTTPYQPPPSSYRAPRDVSPPIYEPGLDRYPQENFGAFEGTPYARASIEVQQRLVFDAQIFLSRRGYYRSDIDGIFGPGTAFALRAFQTERGLAPTGRLDLSTLGALGLLPRQRGPVHRYYPRPVYRGEWVPG